MSKRSSSKVPASWRGPSAPDEAAAPRRYVTEADLRNCQPVYAVWEITLKCDLACNHCGSRAGKARPAELSTEECFDVIDQLAKMGCREVTVIGGEAYLRKDWVDLIARIRDQGMDATMTTGGKNLTEERVKAAADAGLQGVSVSIDGVEATHDKIRGVHGSHRAALESIERLKRHGITVGCNTQINALSWKQLPQIMDTIIGAGASHWQVQLTVAMGNAVDHPELLLQPYQLAELYPELNFTRDRTTNDLWGRCKSCYYADVCRAGCSWTTTVLFGKPGNNPYCHWRVLELEKEGLRERIVKIQDAPGTPFDQGKFEVIEESIHLPVPAPAASTLRPPRGRAPSPPVAP